MTIGTSAYTPACAKHPEAYLDEQYDFPPARSELTIDEWQQLSERLALVRRECASCPVLFDCLYRAVVEVDVFGYAACTTALDRQHIREMLGIEYVQSGNDEACPPRPGTGTVDHGAILAMRRQHPSDTFRQLAERLGCSLSTVKRHLRHARELENTHTEETRRVPTVAEVLDCFDQLDRGRGA